MKCAIVDERISAECERSLLIRGFKVIKLPAAKNLGQAVKSHPDMIMFRHKNRIITSGEYCEECPYIFSDLREYAEDLNFTFTADEFGSDYPSDAIFNALTVGDKLFCKSDTVSSAVLEYARGAGLTLVHVNQGYPACTVLAFGNAAITADRGMASALRASGVRVTEISCGNISLPPYEYGFIGGASGVFSDTVYFLGSIDTHPDGEKIKAAIAAEGFGFVSLSEEKLCDLGRIIFV